MIPDDSVKKIIEFHKQRFTQSWQGAFLDYATKYIETRPVHSKLSRAMILRDHCIDHVRRNFADRIGKDVDIVEEGNLFLVVMSGEPVGIDDSVAARLKKFNEKMMTSNIPTKQANNFAEQKPVVIMFQLPLFGQPIVSIKGEPVHVNIGYRPNDLHTDVEGVYASMPNGKRSIKWFIKISDDDAGSEGVVIDMPVTPSSQDPNRRQVRVKKKSSS